MKLLIALTIAVLLIASLLALRSSHLSSRLSSAVVTCDGEASVRSAVYQNKDGTLCLLLRGAKEPPWDPIYILSLADHQVYKSSPSNYSVLPGYLFTWHPEHGGVPVGGVKSEVTPNVIVGEKSFEFTAEFTSSRVVVRW
jgi:hypothetical protein